LNDRLISIEYQLPEMYNHPQLLPNFSDASALHAKIAAMKKSQAIV